MLKNDSVYQSCISMIGYKFENTKYLNTKIKNNNNNMGSLEKKKIFFVVPNIGYWSIYA